MTNICKHLGCTNEIQPPRVLKNRPKKDGTYVIQNYNECKLCSNLRTNYGITTPQRDAMLKQQKYKCKICTSPIEFLGTIHTLGKHVAVVDHCHTNGHIRGILCGSCNTLLGKMQDSTKVLQGFIDYLNSNKPNQ